MANYFEMLNIVNKFEFEGLSLGSKFPIEVNVLMDNFGGKNLGNKFAIKVNVLANNFGGLNLGNKFTV